MQQMSVSLSEKFEGNIPKQLSGTYSNIWNKCQFEVVNIINQVLSFTKLEQNFGSTKCVDNTFFLHTTEYGEGRQVEEEINKQLSPVFLYVLLALILSLCGC
uniref:Uncharacterized protein n=1 Tax=Trichobilharzia regenti TaxID=157069 RepID=A0AA85IY17_TRIRE|nr:unnamed protein product [Trichobilharzia regenti]